MWEAIRRNRRQSLALVAAIAGLLVAVGTSIGAAWEAPWMGLSIAFVIWAVLALTSWYGGSHIVLWASDCREITKEDAPQLFNVVEEMSIASGLPMPKVYIIEDTAPNAFATGRDPKSSAIAVTRGLLDKLNRDELQGVIAHEMAHIRNRDTLYLTLVGVLVGTVVLICDLYLRATWYGAGRKRRSSRSGPAGAAMVLLALVLAIVAPILARLLYLAVSRRREYLADATAVEFTRYPEGLASALEKIAADKEVLEVANRATAHMYIVNPIKPFEERYSALGSTHPPIQERIAILRAMAGASIAQYDATRMALGIGPRRALVDAQPDRPAPKGEFGKAVAIMAAAELIPQGGTPITCECGAHIPHPPGKPGIVQCMKCGKLHDLRRKTEPPPPPPPEPHAQPARPARESSRSRTAAFEAAQPAAPKPAEPPILQERKMLQVDWAKNIGPVKGPTTRLTKPPDAQPPDKGPKPQGEENP